MARRQGGSKANSKDKSFSIQVAVRVRPLLGHDRSQSPTIQTQDNVVIALDPDKLYPDGRPDYLRENRTRQRQYDFDMVFGPTASQDEVFAKAGSPMIDVVLSGYNATIFAYGQTGSGKTHTMLGDPSNPGIIGRTLLTLFQSGENCKFQVSFVELYNEEIRDLLNRKANGHGLDLREDPIKGPQIAGVKQIAVRSPDDVLKLVHEGNLIRATEGTAANPVSSRSHAVIQISMEVRKKAKDGRTISRHCKLSLIDLAGSERASKTENRGARLTEGAKINRSLLALGNCINALSKKGMYVNFRDSKLTRLLKDSLGGNTRTVMIAHASPSVSSFEETLNTLKYAHRARAIETSVRVCWKPVKQKYGEGILQDNDVDRIRDSLAKTCTNMNNEMDEEPPKTPPRGRKKSGRGDGRKAERKGDDWAENDGEIESVAFLGAIEMLKQTRKQMVGQLREQTALKQSMLELDDQNQRNRIEISKLQMSVMPSSMEKRKDQQDPVRKEPQKRRVRMAKKDVTALKKAIQRNTTKKHELKDALRTKEKTMQPIEQRMLVLLADIEAQSDAKMKARLTRAEEEICMLEMAKLEYEQAQVMQEGMLRERELALQKLQLQIQLRDRAIEGICKGVAQGGFDINTLLRDLAVGPMENLLLNNLVPERFCERKEHDEEDEMSEDGNDGGHDAMNGNEIHNEFRDLAMSLKRSVRLDGIGVEESKASDGVQDEEDEDGFMQTNDTDGTTESKMATARDHADYEDSDDFESDDD